MLDYARAENRSGGGEHLRDENFIRLIEAVSLPEALNSAKKEAHSTVAGADSGEIAALRKHLVGCDSCLAQFREFYAFFAPVETGEITAGKNEIAAAWQAFASRIVRENPKPNLWSRLFTTERKPNYFAAFGWNLAALLLILTAAGFFALRQATSEKNELAAQLENQKQTSEERLKTLEESEQNSQLAGREKERLEAEKIGLQKQIDRLQTEIARAKEQPQTFGDITPPPQNSPSARREKLDDSLVAVNTLIFDVFPADVVSRSGEKSQNKFVIPANAKNVVLILNAAGRADFGVYKVELFNNSGKIIWRGGGLRKDATGNFTLTLAAANLKAGNYRLKLSGKTSGGAFQTVAEYPIIIENK